MATKNKVEVPKEEPAKKTKSLLSEETIVGEVHESLVNIPDEVTAIDVVRGKWGFDESKEAPVVSDPYMAVQGKPVAPSKVYQAERDGSFINLTVPYQFKDALNIYLADYGTVNYGNVTGGAIDPITGKRSPIEGTPASHYYLMANISTLFPVDEVFASVLSMLERMEKLYLSEKES